VLPDGTPVAVSGGKDGTVRVWDLLGCRTVGDPLAEHTASVHAVVAVALPDGVPVAVTGDLDGTVLLWDLRSRRALGAPMTGHVEPVLAATTAVSVDGRPTVVTGGMDHAVRLWEVPCDAPGGPSAPGTLSALGTRPVRGAVQAVASVDSGTGRLLVIAADDLSCVALDEDRVAALTASRPG
jgi:WD40 repeat protein